MQRNLGRLMMWTGVLMTLAILVPFLIVTAGHDEKSSTSAAGEQEAQPTTAGEASSAAEQLYVRVQLDADGKIERVPLEQYVRGVVAAEMPESFELEALKAQAIAARTYIVRRLAHNDASASTSGADIGATVADQAYVSLAELAKRPPSAVEKLDRAVRETDGLIVTYDNQPIEALYFSTSNGFTENAEDYWSKKLPYLRSVVSPWDEKLSPRYEDSVRMKVSAFLEKMNLSDQSVPAFHILSSVKGAEVKNPLPAAIRTVSTTAGKRIAEVQIGQETFTGRQLREKLGLASSDISWSWDQGEIIFTTHGYGHGVGMSQYGAQGMALEGKDAAGIITYYYQGVSIMPLKEIWTSLVHRSKA